MEPRKTIEYAGDTLFFQQETNNIDFAQNELNTYRFMGLPAACTHENGKHQIYALYNPEEKHGFQRQP